MRQNVKDLNDQAEETLANAEAFIRHESMRTSKGRITLSGVQPVNVCDNLEQRELIQPSRKVNKPVSVA